MKFLNASKKRIRSRIYRKREGKNVRRAIGRGLKRCFIQFMNGRVSDGMITAKKFPISVLFRQVDLIMTFILFKENYRRAKMGMEIAEERMKEFDVVVLDEVNYSARHDGAPKKF